MKMSVKTQNRDNQDEIVISLEGMLDFETTTDLRNHLNKLEMKNNGVKVIFDLGELQFVGSSGISAFIQALRDFNSRSTTKPGYANVRSEFRKVISAFDEEGSFEFVEPGFRNTPISN